MTTKEQPLIDAVSKLGALPKFLFFHPTFTGFVVVYVVVLCGATVVLFWASSHGVVEALELFDLVRGGAIAGVVFASIFFTIYAVLARRSEDDTGHRYKYAAGGLLGITSFFFIDFLSIDAIREALVNAPPIVQAPGRG